MATADLTDRPIGKRTCWANDSPDMCKLIDLREKGISITKIARVFGVTRQMVDLILKRQEREGFPDPCRPCNSVTLAQLSIEMSVPKYSIMTLIKSHNATFVRRSKHIYIDAETANIIKHWWAGEFLRCVYCRKTYPMWPVGKRHLIPKTYYCSRAKCSRMALTEKRRRYYRAATKRYSEASAPMGVLKGWGNSLWQKLKGWRSATNEHWVSRAEALRITGISSTQLQTLIRRKILLTRPHPNRKWLGTSKPINTMPVSQLRILREVHKQWVREH